MITQEPLLQSDGNLRHQGIGESTRFSNHVTQILPLRASCLLGLSQSEAELLLATPETTGLASSAPSMNSPADFLGVGASVTITHSENRTLLLPSELIISHFPKVIQKPRAPCQCVGSCVGPWNHLAAPKHHGRALSERRLTKARAKLSIYPVIRKMHEARFGSHGLIY